MSKLIQDEARMHAISAYEILLKVLGYYDTPGTKDTPKRAATALVHELCGGLWEDPCSHLDHLFVNRESDEMIMQGNIPVVSVCEHHLLPFIGKAWVAYLPQDGVVVGLSKIVRLVNGFARRPQIQERLTFQIAHALFDHPKLRPLGVGVLLECTHLCMAIRGVQTPDTVTKTSAMLGAFRDKPETRAEFFALRTQG